MRVSLLCPPLFLTACMGVGLCASPAPSSTERTATQTQGEVSLPDPDREQILAHLNYLCSDELEGRKTGTKGDQLAAAYLANHFKEMGLQPIKAEGHGGPTPYHLPWASGVIGWAPLEGSRLAFDEAARADWWWESFRGYVHSSNVAGVIPGEDPALKNQYILVCAHFDHLGKHKVNGSIYRGADDNASGTTGVMELARCLKDSKPRRSILLLGVSGEEQFLVGSGQFVKKKYVPMESIKGAINMDMIGRNDASTYFVAPVMTANIVPTLARDVRVIAEKYQIPLSSSDKRVKNSDQWSFIQAKIPTLAINTGRHDDLHTVNDTVDKVQPEKMIAVLKIARDLVYQIACDDQAPGWVDKGEWSKWKWLKLGWPHEATTPWWGPAVQ